MIEPGISKSAVTVWILEYRLGFRRIEQWIIPSRLRYMVNKPTGSVAPWASSYSESFRKTTQQTREEALGWRDGGGRSHGGQKKTSPCATPTKGRFGQ